MGRTFKDYMLLFIVYSVLIFRFLSIKHAFNILMTKFYFTFFNAQSPCNKLNDFKIHILRQNYDVLSIGETMFNENI